MTPFSKATPTFEPSSFSCTNTRSCLSLTLSVQMRACPSEIRWSPGPSLLPGKCGMLPYDLPPRGFSLMSHRLAPVLWRKRQSKTSTAYAQTEPSEHPSTTASGKHRTADVSLYTPRPGDEQALEGADGEAVGHARDVVHHQALRGLVAGVALQLGG